MTAMGPSMGLVEQEETTQAEPDDEITNLLLRWLPTYSNIDQHFYTLIRHERQKGAGGAVAGLGAADDSDSDNRSDDSDDGGMGLMQVLQMEPASFPLLDEIKI